MASYNNFNDNYAGIINALQDVRTTAGEKAQYYPPNYQGIIDAIRAMSKDWAGGSTDEYPPGWVPEYDDDGNVIGGSYPPGFKPPQGDLWFDTRQGRLMIYVDDAYYQTNGADVLTKVQTSPPAEDVPGALWYNPDTDDLYLWNGNGWILISSSSVTTSTLPLSSPSTVSADTRVLPDSSGLATQADFNNWVYSALELLDQNPGGSAEVYISDTPPSSAEEGDLWYATGSLQLLVRYDNFWVPSAIPLTSDPNFLSLQTTVISNAQQVGVQLDQARARLAALEQEEHKSYSLGVSSVNDSIVLTDEVGATSIIPVRAGTGLGLTVDSQGITYDASSLSQRVSAVETNKLNADLHYQLNARTDTLESKVNTLEAVEHVSLNTFNQLSSEVALLPSSNDVNSKLSLTGGDMLGQINMGGNRISGLPAAIHPNDPVRNAELTSFAASVASTYLPINSAEFPKINISRDDIAVSAVKVTDGAAGGRRAFEINSNRATGANVIFGQTDHAGEMAWQFNGGENFSWIEGTTGKQLRVDADGVTVKDLAIGVFLRDGSGNELVMNKIDVKERLETYQTALAGVRSALNSSATFDDFKQSALTALEGI